MKPNNAAIESRLEFIRTGQRQQQELETAPEAPLSPPPPRPAYEREASSHPLSPRQQYEREAPSHTLPPRYSYERQPAAEALPPSPRLPFERETATSFPPAPPSRPPYEREITPQTASPLASRPPYEREIATQTPPPLASRQPYEREIAPQTPPPLASRLPYERGTAAQAISSRYPFEREPAPEPVLPPLPRRSLTEPVIRPLVWTPEKEAASAVPEDGPERRPRTTEELGVRRAILEELALKTMYVSGAASTRELARQLRVSINVADELFGRMKSQLLAHVTGMAGAVPTIALTSPGRTRGLELLSQSQYTGAAPVTLDQYVTQVRRQSVRKIVVRHAEVERAFAGLVIDDKILEQIGTALNSGATIFVHGPAGVGKTAMAETMSRVLAEDDVWIPYAVEVDGQIITVFDPLIHKQVDKGPDGTHDERWVRCRRPSVLVGGELTIDMLDLQFNGSTRYYDGPVQMKANNGVLILDDFGRQRVSPEELLNRWIVPLDRGIDFLTMAGGKKIEVPFEMLVVFATNMNPEDLVDAAFLRRMQTKIRVEPATDEQFAAIFHRVATERGLDVDEEALSNLIRTIRDVLHQPLRGCQPRDLVNQVCWAAQYEERSPKLDQPSLQRAVEAYFLAEA